MSPQIKMTRAGNGDLYGYLRKLRHGEAAKADE
jgi:hypothetical protein